MKGKKRFKHFTTSFNAYFFSRALLCCNKYDESFKAYVASLPEKFIFRFRVLPYGATMTIIKSGEKLEVRNKEDMSVKPDVDVCFKNIEGAFMFFTGKKSLSKCFAQSALVIYGDVANMMTFSHMFDIAASYILAKKYLKKHDRVLLPRPAGAAKIRFITIFWKV